MAQALETVCRLGVVSPYLLAAKLKTSLREAELLIGALLAHGYIKEEEIESCDKCPLHALCPYAGRAQPRSIYYLTLRGREACRAVVKGRRG